jgi:hypothetical protein
MSVLSRRALIRRCAAAGVGAALAATPLVLSPTALASSGGVSRCSSPSVDHDADASALRVHVVLPVSGCASREHRIFTLTTEVSRFDEPDSRTVLNREERCGPFRSADDVEAGDAPPEYSCVLDVTFTHDAVDRHTRYDIEVSYPGATAERSVTFTVFCTADGDTAVCDE